MKTGIFGGTFDPPHIGHILLAQKAKQQCKLDRIILLPSAVPPHKKSHLSGFHRLELARITAEEYGFELCDWEYKKKSPSYTIETISYMKTLYPGDQLYFIIGGDSMLDFEKWYRWEELITMCSFIVGIRKQSELDAVNAAAADKRRRFGADITVLDIIPVDISSTEIRETGDLSEVPPRVREYIIKNKLY
ncbi:MAG: nicotinate (nicotinamide) nucleotide adenylyltransferase [Bacillota bacterium]|nr:nicotinate (nicotinamide) nucleotide adenylyltransferase [Bacillota bacterium]